MGGSVNNQYGSLDIEQTDCHGDEEDESDSASSSSVSSAVSFSFSKLTRQQKGLLLSICSTDFMIMCCLSLLNPLLPPQANGRNVSGQMQGWIMASFAAGQFIIFPVFGKYVEKIGAKFLYISGIFLAGGCTILIGSLQFVPYEEGSSIFVALFFVLQIALSVGITAEQTCAFALASKEFSGCFSTVFGITEVFVGLGLTVGPLVGELLSGVGGFCLPYFVFGGLVLCSTFLNYCFAPSVVVDEAPCRKLRRKSAFGLLCHPSIIITCFAVICGSAVWSVLDPLLEPHLEEYTLSPAVVGSVFLLLSASYALSCALCGWLADKLPDNRLLMIPGFLLCGLAHCLLAPTPLFGFDQTFNELWLIIVSLILLGVAMSMAIIPSYDIILEIVIESGYPDDLTTHALVAGLWSAMYALGDFIGPVWGGYIQDNIGFAWGLTYTAGACVVNVILLTSMAFYDCYCCEAEDDNSDISEKSPLLTAKTFDGSNSEVWSRGRRLAPVLESRTYIEYSSSYTASLVSSIESISNASDINDSRHDFSVTCDVNLNPRYSNTGSYCPGLPTPNQELSSNSCYGTVISTQISDQSECEVPNSTIPLNLFYPPVSVYSSDSLHAVIATPQLGNSATSAARSADECSSEMNESYLPHVMENGDTNECDDHVLTSDLHEKWSINLSESNSLIPKKSDDVQQLISASFPGASSKRLSKYGAISQMFDSEVINSFSHSQLNSREIVSSPNQTNVSPQVLNNVQNVRPRDEIETDCSQSSDLTSSSALMLSIAQTVPTDLSEPLKRIRHDNVNVVDQNDEVFLDNDHLNIYPNIVIRSHVHYHSDSDEPSQPISVIKPITEIHVKTDSDTIYRSPEMKVKRPKKRSSIECPVSKKISESHKTSAIKLQRPITINPRDGIRAPLFNTYFSACKLPVTEPNSTFRRYRRTLSNPESEHFQCKKVFKNRTTYKSVSEDASPGYSNMFRSNLLPFTETMQSNCMF